MSEVIDDGKNKQTIWYPCRWCENMFLTEEDLQSHLKAFKITGQAPNEYDHKMKWKNMLEYRDKKEPYENDLAMY